MRRPRALSGPWLPLALSNDKDAILSNTLNADLCGSSLVTINFTVLTQIRGNNFIEIFGFERFGDYIGHAK